MMHPIPGGATPSLSPHITMRLTCSVPAHRAGAVSERLVSRFEKVFESIATPQRRTQSAHILNHMMDSMAYTDTALMTSPKACCAPARKRWPEVFEIRAAHGSFKPFAGDHRRPFITHPGYTSPTNDIDGSAKAQ